MAKQWDVVILGGGFAGLACAKRLERLWGHAATERVLLISAENYFVFQPFLPEVIGASIEPRHVTNPIRFVLSHCSLKRANVTKIHLTTRRVEFDPTDAPLLEPVEARHLVLALGSSINLRGVPGMMEHALFVKTLADALFLREHIVKRLEEASLESNLQHRKKLLHFVIVGGGYSGVETAGEIIDLLQAARRFYRTLDASELQVTLIHAGAYLLPELGEDLGQFTQKTLELRGMTVLINRRVIAVGRDYLRFEDGARLESQNVVCTIGNAPNPILSGLEARYEKGTLLTDEYLRVKGYEHIWAIGDGAANPDGYGHFCPPTAQFAVPLGRQAATNIAAALAQRPLCAFRYKARGQMATIGHHKGVCSIFGFRFSGFFAWWLTRTVHLLKLPGIDRKLRVMIDWTFELFFPPDLNYWDLRKTQRINRIHIEPGEVVFHQDEPGNAFYLVEEGVFGVTRHNANGQILWTDRLSTGDHFGEGSFLYGLARQVTVVAKTPAKLLVFASNEFRSILKNFTTLQQALSYTALRSPLEENLSASRWSERLLATSVSNVMRKPILCLPESASIKDAVNTLAESRQEILPVVDSDRKMTAVITEVDIFRNGVNLLTLEKSIMAVASDNIMSVQDGQSVRQALENMYRSEAKWVLVVDENFCPVGMVSYLDMVKAAGGLSENT